MKARQAKFFIFEERHTPTKLKRQLIPGMTREQVHSFYKTAPVSSHLRPESGWGGSNAPIIRRNDIISDPRTFRVVDTYEWLHETKVHRCDVFESPVGHSYFMQLLPDIDYVLFDASDKLVGFHHEIVGD